VLSVPPRALTPGGRLSELKAAYESFAVFAALPAARMLAAGLAATPAGMALVVCALYNPSLGWYLIGSAVAGAGAGLLFKAALGATIATAQPDATAGVLAVFFVIAYVGIGLPPILLAAAGQAMSDRVAITAFSVAIIAISAIVARLQTAALGRSDADDNAPPRAVPQLTDV
jgi:hypothetical protein